MSKQFRPWPAAAMRRASLWRYRLPAVLAAAAFLIQGCAATPPRPFTGAEASDLGVRVPPVSYRPVLSGYVSQRPVAPAAWRQQNERVAPQPKSDQ